MSSSNEGQSFWDHLDELRGVIIRIAVVTTLLGTLAFMFKDEVYAIILAPKDSGFITYRLLASVSSIFAGESLGSFSVKLINIGLAGQFLIHLKSSIYIGVLAVMPYILYQLFQFVAPGLYASERKITFRILASSYVMFMIGVAITYFIIFPLTFRFLGTYQVSSEVENTITIQSYLDTFTMLSLAMGCVFEIPILSWLLAKMGIISSALMRKFRRHVIVTILIIAAIITPTTDIFTLFLVALPMYILFELSILIVRAQGHYPMVQSDCK